MDSVVGLAGENRFFHKFYSGLLEKYFPINSH